MNFDTNRSFQEGIDRFRLGDCRTDPAGQNFIVGGRLEFELPLVRENAQKNTVNRFKAFVDVVFLKPLRTILHLGRIPKPFGNPRSGIPEALQRRAQGAGTLPQFEKCEMTRDGSIRRIVGRWANACGD